MKTIFLTNDDGFESYGLLCLQKALQTIARVIVVAPAYEKSACGHGLCVNKPMRLIEVEKDFYKLDDGTPTDCVYIGIHELFTQKPDLVISGINIGSNMGEDTTYSGTVAGAIEGVIQGIPSIAISQYIQDKYGEENKTAERNFELATSFAANLADSILKGEYHIGERKLLNINIPSLLKSDCKGVRITQLGYRIYTSSIQKNINPRAQEYYWIGLNPLMWKERDNQKNPYINHNNTCISSESTRQVNSQTTPSINKVASTQTTPSMQNSCSQISKSRNSTNQSSTRTSIMSDFKAVNEGYISITPLQLDNTSYEDINRLNEYLQQRDIL